jgi:hypothetical protein
MGENEKARATSLRRVRVLTVEGIWSRVGEQNLKWIRSSFKCVNRGKILTIYEYSNREEEARG